MGRPKLCLEDQYMAVPESGCWIFMGGTDKDGYGHMTGNVRAHRAYYQAYVGSIPDGLCVLHRCDVRCCVNPSHLFLGTSPENTADAAAKSRMVHGERNHASKLTEDAARSIYVATGKLRDIAKQYGVTHRVVYLIKAGRSWARSTSA